LGLLAAAALPAQQEKDKSTSLKDASKSSKADKPPEQLLNVGAFGGKILKVEEDHKAFVLRVYGQTAEPKFTPGNPASC
jgi:hypothetical protein